LSSGELIVSLELLFFLESLYEYLFSVVAIFLPIVFVRSPFVSLLSRRAQYGR